MKFRHVLTLIAVSTCVGCDTSSTPDVAGVGVVGCLSAMRVSPSTLTIAVGDSAQVTALPSDCVLPVPFAVFWRSSNAAVVSVDSLGGKVRGLAAGQATVIALVVNDTTVKGAAVVTVTPR